MSHIKYRKDIDGLRALAVLSVIFFHLDISFFKSGFLGVDIFFVISGYLITSIIIRDLQEGRFSLKNFYLRRARRILPALIAVLVFSSFFAWLVLLPAELRQYAKTMVSALASVSNIYFYNSLSFGYFASDASIIPLLHTWSLGIEEQFYFFWPVTLIFVFNLGISWKQKENFGVKSKVLVVTLLLLSLSLYFFFYRSAQSYYYFPTTRAFELLVGCLVSVYSLNRKPIQTSFFANMLSVIALILMLVPILFIDVQYPSCWMLVVCIGAALYIYAGFSAIELPLVNKFFSINIIVAIGLISYSLYLWHWPIIAYVNYLSIEKTTVVKIVILLLSFVLSIFSYYLVEKPLRFKYKFSILKTLGLLWLLPMIVAIAFALSTKYIPNFGFNKAIGDFKIVSQHEDGSFVYEYPEWQSKHKLKYDSIWQDQEYKNAAELSSLIKHHYDVVIFGDSHAKVAAPMISKWTADLNMTTLVAGGTQLAVYNMIQDKKVEKYIEVLLDKTHPKYFVLAGWWNSYTVHAKLPKDNKALFFMDKIVSMLEKRNIQPVILLDWPSLKGMTPACGMTRVDKWLGIDGCGRPLSDILASQSIELKYINSLQEKYKNLIVIDPKKVICKNGYCSNQLDGVILYLDGMQMDYYGLNNAHLNDYGSYMIGDIYLKRYGNPLEKN